MFKLSFFDMIRILNTIFLQDCPNTKICLFVCLFHFICVGRLVSEQQRKLLETQMVEQRDILRLREMNAREECETYLKEALRLRDDIVELKNKERLLVVENSTLQDELVRIRSKVSTIEKKVSLSLSLFCLCVCVCQRLYVSLSVWV